MPTEAAFHGRWGAATAVDTPEAVHFLLKNAYHAIFLKKAKNNNGDDLFRINASHDFFFSLLIICKLRLYVTNTPTL